MQEDAEQEALPDAAVLDWLEAYALDHRRLALLPEDVRKRLLAACGRIAGASPAERRSMRRALRSREGREKRERDFEALKAAVLRRTRTQNKDEVAALPLHALPARAANGSEAQAAPERAGVPAVLETPRTCYVCKTPFTAVHFFYDSMCAACGDFNHRKRTELCDLAGRVALVTGGRVKIGQEIVLKLLRCGARVIVTTRFAADAARRYAERPDFAEFAGRLEIYGLDLRHTPSVERLCAHLLGSLERLDFLINNACQTVRRPAAFYAHLLENERRVARALTPAARALLGAPDAEPALVHGPGEGLAAALGSGDHAWAAEMSQLVVLEEDAQHDRTLFPEHAYDVDQQQVDLRRVNSWRLRLHEVSTPELLEVQLVNAIAPYVLNARLKPLMERVKTPDKHIVNVSAVEGQFSRGTKTDKHPHTNMAKAALNMMTRTAAQDYRRSGIFMNSVDTGWVTDEDPAEHALRKEREGFQPPLDTIDGAARVCDPIIHGHRTGEHVHGLFLKNYAPAEW